MREDVMSEVFSAQDIACMQVALAEARRAGEAGDVPVGAALFRPCGASLELVAVGRNTREVEQSALGHAELNALRDACDALHSWRLSDCVLYVTLEPCPMCAGALLAARVGRVVCGTRDPEAGAMGSVWALHRHPTRVARVAVEYGCCEAECRALLQEFFRARRGTDGENGTPFRSSGSPEKE